MPTATQRQLKRAIKLSRDAFGPSELLPKADPKLTPFWRGLRTWAERRGVSTTPSINTLKAASESLRSRWKNPETRERLTAMVRESGRRKREAVSFPFTPEQLKQEYASGLTCAEIGLKYDISSMRVWYALKRFGIARRAANMRLARRIGSNCSRWVGDWASYSSFHQRVTRMRGRPKKCEVCGTDALDRVYEWANLTGNYADPFDYKRMCWHCHRGYDRSRRIAAREALCPPSA